MIGQKGAPAVWGGVERHVEHLSIELGKRGHDVVIYARKHYVNAEQVAAFERATANVSVRFLPTLHTKNLDAITHTFFATMAAVFRRVDVYHYHGVGPSLLSWIPRLLRPRATVVTTFHSPDRQHQKWGRFAKLMLWLGEWTAVHFSHYCITVSKELQQYALDTYGVRTYYVPNAVDVPVYAEASQIRALYGIRPRKYFVLVSRLIPHKGAHIAIQAFQRCADLDMQLVIVGDASHTESYVEQLHALAKDDPRIIFTGFQHGRVLHELWSNAYAFIQPSFSEGLSISLLEAASYGLPVMSSSIPANVEIVGEEALLYAPEDVEALANHMRTAATHPDRMEKMAKTLRKRVESTYAWDVVTTSVENVYRERLHQKAGDIQSWRLRTLP